ncbi:hypothetical protein JG688_00012253 [Phytophthora aleatoria]|uniref:SWIM-type domain-containing protein n=1 Tax=Phytophthora aleatoria TaxID=2496075 RepID=A0A8J5J363_9STRA|nr:hypothetical protein JG688_00012253 [Phytophthora aleatoria]
MAKTGRKRTTGKGAKPKLYKRSAVSYQHTLEVLLHLGKVTMEETAAQCYPGFGRHQLRNKKRQFYAWKAVRSTIEVKCARGSQLHCRDRSRGMGATLPAAAEEQLVQWTNCLHADEVPVTSLMLKLQAIESYGSCNLPHGAFAATWSWRNHFLRRHKLAILRRTRIGQTAPGDAVAFKMVPPSRANLATWIKDAWAELTQGVPRWTLNDWRKSAESIFGYTGCEKTLARTPGRREVIPVGIELITFMKDTRRDSEVLTAETVASFVHDEYREWLEGYVEVSNRVSLETHRAEEIARSRHEEKATHLAIHGKQRVTRNTAALLKKDREEDADSPPGERWESRALRHIGDTSDESMVDERDGEEEAEALSSESEHKANSRKVVKIFKRNNADWHKIRVIMTDKAVHEKDVLCEMFPQATQLLCQWHVVTWLKKQAAWLAKPVRKEVKALMSLLVYAKSDQEYEDAKGAMLEKIGGNEAHPLYKTFDENWDNSQDQWVSYKRGNVPHLTNNTNNRIESKWGKIKDVIKDTFTIDELVSTLITLQEYAEEQYIAEYNRVGGRPSGLNEDPELASLALQISEFALKLVSEEHALATGPDADYTVNIGSAATATVTSGRTASTYEVDTARSHCRCAFMKTCLLPCRHVMFVRSKCNYETVIPPMRFFSTRLIVHNKALSSSSKYIDAKALAEKIVDRIALQSTPTYRVALQWLQDFYEARNAGTVVGFTQREDTLFPRLSQVSSVGAARLSQMSLLRRGQVKYSVQVMVNNLVLKWKSRWARMIK